MAKKTGFFAGLQKITKAIEKENDKQRKIKIQNEKSQAQRQPSQRVIASNPSPALDNSPAWGKHEKIDVIQGLQKLNVRYPGWTNLAAAGESFYENTARYLVAKMPVTKDSKYEVYVLPEPLNKFDKNAVAICVLYEGEFHKIASLSRGDAETYSPELQTLMAEGWLCSTIAKINIDKYVSIYVGLNPANRLKPLIGQRESHEILLGDRLTTIAKSSNYQTELKDLYKYGSEIEAGIKEILVKIEFSTVEKGKYLGQPLIEIFDLRNIKVGELTPDKSLTYYAFLKKLSNSGKKIVAEANLNYNSEADKISGFILLPRKV